MENASKALLIAGGVLLALLIISAGVSIYMILNNNAKTYSAEMETSKIQQINIVFEKYKEREDIKIQEIISLVNYVEEKQNEIPSKIYIKVNKDDWTSLNETEKLEKIKTDKKNYQCISITYNEQGQVKEIRFQSASIIN